MTPKTVKASTKWLGYALLVSAILQMNIIWYINYKGGNLDVCTDITKYSLAVGVILLLGRKAISEIIVRIFGKVVVK